MAVSTFGCKAFFGNFFFKASKICFNTDIFFGKEGPFLFAQLCPVVARTWCPLRSGCFIWARELSLRPKIRMQPPERRSISHLGLDYSTFRLRVTVVFVKKRPPRQKVFPHPCMGAPSASNSPSTLSARAG